MQLSSFQCFIGQESHIKCIRQHHNGAVFIPVFHWTSNPFFIPVFHWTRISYKMSKTASQWSCHHSSVSLDKQSNIKCIRQHHNGAVFIPVFHWTRIPYKMYKTASQWSCHHSSVSLNKNPL